MIKSLVVVPIIIKDAHGMNTNACSPSMKGHTKMLYCIHNLLMDEDLDQCSNNVLIMRVLHRHYIPHL